jgi:hypothetical protein
MGPSVLSENFEPDYIILDEKSPIPDETIIDEH